MSIAGTEAITLTGLFIKFKNISTEKEHQAATIMYDRFDGRINAIYANGTVIYRVQCQKERRGSDYSEKPIIFTK